MVTPQALALDIWEFRKLFYQLQMTSTESFFITFGHGSPPKISGVTGTVQEFWPTQVCKKREDVEAFIEMISFQEK